MRTSYGLLGERNWSICMMTSSALDSARAHTLTFPLSHLSHSESQLPTSDVGHTMTALFTTGFPPSSSEPCLRSVHSRVRPWRVFPRPMSSARMQPLPSKSLRPHTHSNMNCTPSLWWGLSHLVSILATSTVSAGTKSASPSSLSLISLGALDCHSTSGSPPSSSDSPVSWLDVGSGGSPLLPQGTNLLRMKSLRFRSLEWLAPHGDLKGALSTASAPFTVRMDGMSGLLTTRISMLPARAATFAARCSDSCSCVRTGSSSSSSSSSALYSSSSSSSSAPSLSLSSTTGAAIFPPLPLPTHLGQSHSPSGISSRPMQLAW
mmetsp:Transcript_10023/g.30529  ORF Transcript_10023/g.30529 Transcript_10023/m.30529 type:complete len:320 (-) Transcript_10023:213-1172(-)